MKKWMIFFVIVAAFLVGANSYAPQLAEVGDGKQHPAHDEGKDGVDMAHPFGGLVQPTQQKQLLLSCFLPPFENRECQIDEQNEYEQYNCRTDQCFFMQTGCITHFQYDI